MSINQCINGHLYDSGKYEDCPFCQEERFGTYVSERTGFDMPVHPSENATTNQFNKKQEPPYIFISYSHLDSKEVIAVIDFLKANHFNVWYDEGIKSGSEWADEISRRIKHCKQFICFMSRNSVLSESVKDEIHIAWKYNINIIVVYLEKVVLDGGLEMKLDRKQAIMKHSLDEQAFLKKLSSSITQDAFNLKNDNIIDDTNILDKYSILSELSKGGTSTVYLAKNKKTGVNVVLKCCNYDDTFAGSLIRKGVETEKKVLSENISPFIPTLYDYSYDSHNFYIAESYIEGIPVSQMKKRPLGEIIDVFIGAAKVIKELHDKGYVHCDIKPEHIIVNRHGCFLIDFGSVKDIHSAASDDFRMGTVAYAAPEQFASYNGEQDMFGNYVNTETVYNPAGTIDIRTDIYAFGRTMIKTISGDYEYDKFTEDEKNVTTANITTVLFASSTKKIGGFVSNPLLQAIIEKMTREKKDERYSNMNEVIRVLEDFNRLYK